MWCVEIAKFLITVLAAWLAVWWAFNRYKAERLWDRRITAYSELIAALSTIDQVLGIWEFEEATQRKPTAETDDEIRKRYWDARRKLEEAQGIASLLLPADVMPILTKLQSDLAGARNSAADFMEVIGNEWTACAVAKKKLIEVARPDLDPQLLPLPWRKKLIKSSSKA